MTSAGISCFDRTSPFLYARYAAAKGPMALATSLAPCENLDGNQAVSQVIDVVRRRGALEFDFHTGANESTIAVKTWT